MYDLEFISVLAVEKFVRIDTTLITTDESDAISNGRCKKLAPFFFTSAITYGIYVCIEPYTAQMI